MNNSRYILTMNAGSSSIKITLFNLISNNPKKVLEGTVNNIGENISSIIVNDNILKEIHIKNHLDSVDILMDLCKNEFSNINISAIGHRVVHGGSNYFRAQIITDNVFKDLKKLTSFDPDHLPYELQLIEKFQKLYSGVKQIACFDTEFHYNIPNRARLLPIPRHFESEGIRRFGFHGLSYEYILENIQNKENKKIANGKIIIAHLGSGASLTAINKEKSIDTTMGFTPTGGIPMSTRSGDIDPGLVLYLTNVYGFDAKEFNTMVNFKSGLLGISDESSDMKKLLEMENSNQKAKDAIDVFCYAVKKSIGGFIAAMGGLDMLVFTGGIGENAPQIRKRICEDLECMGIIVQDDKNIKNEYIISSGKVKILVMHTDESIIIAKKILKLI